MAVLHLCIGLRNLDLHVVTSCYQVHALNANAHLSAALLCYVRCNWCRNLVAVNCILHWIVLTYPRCRLALHS